MSTEENPKQAGNQSSSAQSDVVMLSWVTHPARTRPLVSALVVLLLTALVLIVYHLTASLIFSAVAALILWGSLTQYFMPTRFELTDRGVRVKYTFSKIEKEWRLFRSYYVDRNGVLLSPFVRPSRLENFRGLYVRFAGNKDEVVRLVSERIEMPGDDLD